MYVHWGKGHPIQQVNLSNNAWRESMNGQHLRILSIIADLDRHGEVDEFQIALECGAIPSGLPRHAWVNHACRGDLLRGLTCLEQGGLIYVTRRGYWGSHLTQRGRDLLATAIATTTAAAPDDEIIPKSPLPPVELPVWSAPRPSNVIYSPRSDHFYSTVALAVVGLGTVLLLIFGQVSFNPLARHIAASDLPTAERTAPAPTAPAAATPALPILPTATVVPTATKVPLRTFVVANTGNEGVYLRRTPAVGEKLAVYIEGTVLVEVSPETVMNGVTWLHVRAPDGTTGYLPTTYTSIQR